MIDMHEEMNQFSKEKWKWKNCHVESQLIHLIKQLGILIVVKFKEIETQKYYFTRTFKFISIHIHTCVCIYVVENCDSKGFMYVSGGWVGVCVPIGLSIHVCLYIWCESQKLLSNLLLNYFSISLKFLHYFFLLIIPYNFS